MKHLIPVICAAAVLPGIVGCGQDGPSGGAYQATSVVVLPPEYGLGVEEDGDESSAGDSGGSAESGGGSGPGNFAGRVVLTGTAPQLGPIFTKGAAIKDPEVCAAEDMPDDRLVLGADNGVANVFIYIRKAPKGSPKPTVSDEPMIFDQKYCRFIPHCQIVPVGQVVKVLSDDAAAHNTHTNPKRNNTVSSLVGANDREGKLELVYKKSEQAPFPVTCDFHGWMKAWHFPVDHPYAALTDADGNFEIRDLPAGNHEFVVWHEAAKGQFVERKLKVSIQPGETFTQEIEFAASQLELN